MKRPLTPSPPADVIQAVKHLRSPVVIGHVVPDSDALGSMFSMVRALNSPPYRPTASLPDGSLSQRLKFLFDMAGVPIATPDDFVKADGFIVFDTAKQPRCNVGKERAQTDWIGQRPIINIDHHATNTKFGTTNWIEDHAGSACEMLYYLLSEADLPIDSVTASLLYAGINSDTLGFTLATTSAAALAAAADLVVRGANVELLGERLYRSQTQSEFDLLRIIYANTKTTADGAIVYSSASFDEIRGAGCTAADIDDQISVPRSLAGARLAMLFTEGNQGQTRINFRGTGDLGVLDLASQFNGGGHRQAAGAILDCHLEEAIKRVLPRAVEHLARFKP